jgi:hypothetical protein
LLREKKIFSSSGSSSSFNNNKYISNARVHAEAGQTSGSKGSIELEGMANYLEIQRRGRWGDLDAARDEAWTRKYLPWLAHEPFQPYVLWLFAGRANLLPVIWQKVKPLPKHSQEMVIYQLLGHSAAWKHGWREPIRDTVAYLHCLVKLQNANQLFPDEWALKLKRCKDNGEDLIFTDSPDLIAMRNRYGE